ncbi:MULTISPECIES: transposase [unclassified Streptomyces]|uniref:transposase n=1 Tax=unclassified Streptomyces TaxID=2593676 RepID=UPI0033B091BB
MRRFYTVEFKRDAVALALSSEKTVTEVARDPGVRPEGLRGSVKQAKIDRGEAEHWRPSPGLLRHTTCDGSARGLRRSGRAPRARTRPRASKPRLERR